MLSDLTSLTPAASAVGLPSPPLSLTLGRVAAARGTTAAAALGGRGAPPAEKFIMSMRSSLVGVLGGAGPLGLGKPDGEKEEAAVVVDLGVRVRWMIFFFFFFFFK